MPAGLERYVAASPGGNIIPFRRTEDAAIGGSGGDRSGIHQGHRSHLPFAGFGAFPVGKISGGMADGKSPVSGNIPGAKTGTAETGSQNNAGPDQFRPGSVFYQVQGHGLGSGIHGQGKCVIPRRPVF
jgi:hypothetical protein